MPQILLIEDEEGFGEALEYQLEREGFEVNRYTDGAVGLERFKTSGADLVLLDLMLPGVSGEDICKEIRRSSSVPIIMLTARDTEIDKVLGLELGADDYVTKPFSSRELFSAHQGCAAQKLQRVGRRRRSSRERRRSARPRSLRGDSTR